VLHIEAPPDDSSIWPNRQPSPLLSAEFSFREEFLINHYFDVYHHRRASESGIGNEMPASSEIQRLVISNPALRHAICALSALTLPYQSRPLSREILGHLGTTLAILRKVLSSRNIEQGTLMAVIVLVDFERSSGNHSNWQVHFDAALSILVCLPFLHREMLTLTSLELYFLRSLTFDDIIAATALCREPVMFLRHIHDLNVGLGVRKLTGCNDRVLAGINQGAQLDAWKAQQRLAGALSTVELYKNGSRILMQLWEGTGVVEGLSAIVAETFRCAAVIYINVVMSGCLSSNH
jgi:hypothetical protein